MIDSAGAVDAFVGGPTTYLLVVLGAIAVVGLVATRVVSRRVARTAAGAAMLATVAVWWAVVV